MEKKSAHTMEVRQVVVNTIYYGNGYGFKLEVPATKDMLTPRGMTVIKEVLEKIEQLSRETV
jgi:hypothetical protein